MSSPATPELRSTMSVNYHRAPEHTLFHGLIAPLSPQEYNELGAHHPYESLADFNEALSGMLRFDICLEPHSLFKLNFDSRIK